LTLQVILRGCFPGLADADGNAFRQRLERVFIGGVVAEIKGQRAGFGGGFLDPADGHAFVPANAGPDFENLSSFGYLKRVAVENHGGIHRLADLGEAAGGCPAEVNAGG
jgi:hypothetical protein